MNNYGFDYLNYITNIPGNNPYNNGTNNIFPMKYQNDNQSKTNTTNNNQLVDPNQGLKRGNLFANLYDPYKSFKPNELTPNNEQEALLYQILQYKFALTDLNLYLDTNPNDRNILALFNQYLNIEKQMCNKYENMYGPLTIDNLNQNNTWNWNNSPWPWEVK